MVGQNQHQRQTLKPRKIQKIILSTRPIHKNAVSICRKPLKICIFLKIFEQVTVIVNILRDYSVRIAACSAVLIEKIAVAVDYLRSLDQIWSAWDTTTQRPALPPGRTDRILTAAFSAD